MLTLNADQIRNIFSGEQMTAAARVVLESLIEALQPANSDGCRGLAAHAAVVQFMDEIQNLIRQNGIITAIRTLRVKVGESRALDAHLRSVVSYWDGSTCTSIGLREAKYICELIRDGRRQTVIDLQPNVDYVTGEYTPTVTRSGEEV